MAKNCGFSDSLWGGYKISDTLYLVWSICENCEGIEDYKIFNFNGVPKLIEVDYDRFVNHKRNLYTVNWEYIDARIQYPSDSQHFIQKPERLLQILDLSKKLSLGIPHLRTDFYIIDGKVYFGELTFYHESGMGKISPPEFEMEMSNWLELKD
ncbi:hypothetical protein C804_06312 [Lachnospiraceae bacterium A4]|nr:hypothetical protein C804_06312 [Lachnospiraceae bacterium A4]